MPGIDWDTVLRNMRAAAEMVLRGNWSQATSSMTPVFRSLVKAVADIEAQKAAGAISEEYARELMAIQKGEVNAAVLALEGLGLAAAQEAANAALHVLGAAIDTSIGWSILSYGPPDVEPPAKRGGR